MSFLDSLIDRGEKPKDIEYVYLHNLVWDIEKFGGGINVHYGSIVTDVVQNDNFSYEFTLKENGKRYRCNYAWAFAENTPENLELINEFKEVDKEYEDARKKRHRAIRKIKTLLIPKDEKK